MLMSRHVKQSGEMLFTTLAEPARNPKFSGRHAVLNACRLLEHTREINDLLLGKQRRLERPDEEANQE
jgi:hypothetical protein